MIKFYKQYKYDDILLKVGSYYCYDNDSFSFYCKVLDIFIDQFDNLMIYTYCSIPRGKEDFHVDGCPNCPYPEGKRCVNKERNYRCIAIGRFISSRLKEIPEIKGLLLLGI